MVKMIDYQVWIDNKEWRVLAPIIAPDAAAAARKGALSYHKENPHWRDPNVCKIFCVREIGTREVHKFEVAPLL